MLRKYFQYPDKNLIIIDFGTATTFCAVSAKKEYLGGIIHAGLKISMEALESKTSKLPSVEIVKPESPIGRSSVESIQAGLYYGTIGLVKEVTQRLTEHCFKDDAPLVIGTGGFARLLKGNDLFDIDDPDLVLKGLYIAHKINGEKVLRPNSKTKQEAQTEIF